MNEIIFANFFKKINSFGWNEFDFGESQYVHCIVEYFFLTRKIAQIFRQVFQLESTFDMKRYLSSSERAGLAASLSLTETQVND